MAKKPSRLIWATVITDASFCHKTKKAGWAAWIRIDGISEPIKKYGSFKCHIGTSQIAEKKAALNGISIAKAHGADAVFLQTDCLSVVHLITGFTKKKRPINQWNRWKRDACVSDVKLKAKHVRGHTKVQDARSHVNRWCDEMANAARLAT